MSPEQVAPRAGQVGCEGDAVGDNGDGDCVRETGDGDCVGETADGDGVGEFEGVGLREKDAGAPQVQLRAAKADGSVTLQSAARERAPRQRALADATSRAHWGPSGGENHSGHLSPPVADSTAASVSRSVHAKYAQRPVAVEPRAHGTPEGPWALATQAAVATCRAAHAGVWNPDG